MNYRVLKTVILLSHIYHAVKIAELFLGQDLFVAFNKNKNGVKPRFCFL